MNAQPIRDRRILFSALAHGVKPKAARHLVADAEALFTLQDGQLVAKDGARQPRNPLHPMTVTSWLTDQRDEFPEYFEPLAEH